MNAIDAGDPLDDDGLGDDLSDSDEDPVDSLDDDRDNDELL